MIDKTLEKYIPKKKVCAIQELYKDSEGYHVVLSSEWSYDGKTEIIANGIRELRTVFPRICKKDSKTNLLVLYRTKKGLSRSELAVETGIPYRTLERYEYGQTKLENASIKNIRKIADALNVPVDSLVNLR